MFDEKRSGLRSTSSTPDRELTTTPTPSTRSTGDPSRSIAYVGCGFRASSGLISSANARPSLWARSLMGGPYHGT
jgi:hypothetical protein